MIELKVTGMTCGKCVESVRRVVERAAPNSNPNVDLESGRLLLAEGSGDPAAVRERVMQAIEAAGFGAEVPAA